MALKTSSIGDRKTVGHISHDAQERVDARVEEVLARGNAALSQARRAAQRLRVASTARRTVPDEDRR